jgi:pimeloyl-ACP methyl ester carboxylesterase
VPRGRISAERGVEILDDFLDPLPCPVTVAWSEKDVIIPPADYGPIARERLPQATFEIPPDTAHDPMMDDPQLVARTILSVTGVGS